MKIIYSMETKQSIASHSHPWEGRTENWWKTIGMPCHCGVTPEFEITSVTKQKIGSMKVYGLNEITGNESQVNR